MSLKDLPSRPWTDKARLHNKDIYGPDSDEYPDVKEDTAKGGLAGIVSNRKERSKDEDRNKDIESDNGEADTGKAGDGEAEKEKENGKERKRRKGSGGEER